MKRNLIKIEELLARKRSKKYLIKLGIEYGLFTWIYFHIVSSLVIIWLID
jgi:hypothetical protein